MSVKIDIRLSGTGGQGIISGGIILAEAAVIDGKEVIQTQSYGPEARGGASRAEVIISDEPIKYPKVIIPNYLLLMSQKAADLYANKVAEGGIILVDTTNVPNMPSVKTRVINLPLSQLAMEEIGNKLTTNVLAIGALAAIGNLVTLESLQEATRKRLPKVAALNIRALNLGWDWGKKALENA
ncbi:MAG: 2-oxoacid:ferredoxin oxidoreductase subunit gamma [Clostridia bacterium]|jgi:2-oxoglutarate ferredoxin oxidoreductase subunit gamma|nr:2-oxoacid:ferredoxin oxidoreductase subunit gamma [Clostridia bacterium]